MNEALRAAVKDWEASGKHRSDLVRGITTERTLYRWMDGQKPTDPFKPRQLARRLKKDYAELFGS